MSGRFLLDTNIIIALFAEDAAVHKRIVLAKEVFIPSVVIGELYFGAYKSLKVRENIARIDELVQSNTILSCNSDTAKRYGFIKKELREKGQPIPENDIWIAAIAQQYALRLVTKDAHFSAVEKLKIEVW